jgi:HTH-type transcriptional regulator/antitoxin MqsA
MKCPACAEAVLVSDKRHLPFVHERASVVIADVEGQFCPACGESVLGPAEAARVSAAMLAFHARVDASAGRQ